MNSDKMEETFPKIIDDEGQVSGPDDTVSGMDCVIARPELSQVLSQSVLADGVPGFVGYEDTGIPTERLLCERVRYLETVVQGQNEDLLRYESKERTHAAALKLLETTKTESSVLEYDRDRLFTENEFNKQQAREMSEKLERFRERQNEMNECLLQTRQDCNDKIAKLENELEHWKRKHESEVPRSYNVGHTESEQVEQLIHTEQAVGIGHEEQVVGLGHREQANGLSTDQTVGFSNTEQTGQLGHTEPSEADELKGDTDASHVINGMSPANKRKCTFLKMKTELPSCRNCMTVFDHLRPYQVECRFHRSFPQPLKAWQHEIGVNKNIHISGCHGYKFWPCCEKISIKAPPGCLELKHHDLLYPDPDDD